MGRLDTDMTLHHASNRVTGYERVITVPASGETVPASLREIVVRLEVAGRRMEQVLEPRPHQQAKFVWDGLDHLGRRVTVPTYAHTSIGFVYDGYYRVPADPLRQAQAFGQFGTDVTPIPTRERETLWRRDKIPLDIRPGGSIAEGWTLSVHHQSNPTDTSVLMRGDGTTSRTERAGFVTLVPTFGSYSDLAVDAAGNLFCITGNGEIMRRRTDGSCETLLDEDFSLHLPLTLDSDGNPVFASRLQESYPVWDSYIKRYDLTTGETEILYEMSWSPLNDGYRHSAVVGIRDIRTDDWGNTYFFGINEAGYDVMRGRREDFSSVFDFSSLFDELSADVTESRGPWHEWRDFRISAMDMDNEGNIFLGDGSNGLIWKVDTGGTSRLVVNVGDSPCPMKGFNDFAVDADGNIFLSQCGSISKVDATTGGGRRGVACARLLCFR